MLGDLEKAMVATVGMVGTVAIYSASMNVLGKTIDHAYKPATRKSNHKKRRR